MKKSFSILIVLGALALAASQARAQVIVIANPNVKSSAVPKGELRDVFTGASTNFKDGSQVTPVLEKSGSVSDEFLSLFIGKNDSVFRAGWRNLVFSGQAAMPKSVDSDAAMVDYVAHTPGAVGYIGKSAPHDGVKVIEVK